jgi:hypothetical protein
MKVVAPSKKNEKIFHCHLQCLSIGLREVVAPSEREKKPIIIINTRSLCPKKKKKNTLILFLFLKQ